MNRVKVSFAQVLAVLVALLVMPASTAQEGASEEDVRIARSLAAMLQSARSVISAHQERINDPGTGDKGLTAEVVLEEAVANYRERTGIDPEDIDADSYEGRLLRAQMDAVAQVMNDNQALINEEGTGFKGFIPATFARLVTEAFAERVGEEATIKVTAPPELVRNRRSRPDEWEVAAIRDYLQQADWPRGQLHSGVDTSGAEPRVRIMVPEYYSASCLTCHGVPAGELDITGYPKEGAALDDLGGVISIGLMPQ
jgi:hypothetical protein